MLRGRSLINSSLEQRQTFLDERDRECLLIRLLGGFSVSLGGREIDDANWRLSKARTLVQTLALSPGHRIHREQALDRLWPQRDIRSAAGNLYQVIHAARRALDQISPPDFRLRDSIQLRKNVISLLPPIDLWIDAMEFDRRSRSAIGTFDPTLIHAAIDVYYGELLPESPYEDWLAPHRQLLGDRYWTLLIELAEAKEASGNYDAALDAFRQAVTIDSTRERGHAGIMRVEAELGQKTLALAQYEQLTEVIRAEIGDEPDQSILHLREDIERGRLGARTSSAQGLKNQGQQRATTPNNIPRMLTRFVGREREISDLCSLMRKKNLVTITGPGGSGKSRLAAAVAQSELHRFSHGVWFVDLSAVYDSAFIGSAVAHAIPMQPSIEWDITSQLRQFIQGKQMLLVIDGCEHLLTGSAEIVRAILASGPGVRVLATSREQLHVDGEVIWRIPLLTTPMEQSATTVEALQATDSVELFVDRAQLVSPEFQLDNSNARHVADICRLLEGLPMAIEIAAARVRVLSTHQILQRLQDSFESFPSAGEISNPLLQPLRMTLEWSHELLGERDQLVLMRAAVFRGTWTLEAAEAVIADESDVPGIAVLDSLTRLIDKSLIIAESGAVPTRYRMLDTVRQFALERLFASGELDLIMERYASYYTALAAPADSNLRSSGQARTALELEQEYENLHSALEWYVDRQQLQSALQLGYLTGRFLVHSGAVDEGRQRLERLAANPSSHNFPYEYMRVLFWIGRMAYLQGNYFVAETWLKKCLETASTHGDLSYTAGAQTQLGHIAFRHGSMQEARALYTDALEVRRQIGDPWYIAVSLRSLGQSEFEQGNIDTAWSLIDESALMLEQSGDSSEMAASLLLLGQIAFYRSHYRQARHLLETGLDRARHSGFWLGTVNALNSLGMMSRADGAPQEAWNYFVQGLSILRDVHSHYGLADSLESLAGVLVDCGEVDSAIFYLGSADAVRTSLMELPSLVQRAQRSRILEVVQRTVDLPELTPSWMKGRSTPREQVVRQAISRISPRGTGTARG